jgi:hypothetical protein
VRGARTGHGPAFGGQRLHRQAGPVSPAHGEVGSHEAARLPTGTARRRRRSEPPRGATLANHVTFHVTPTYKAERATTQPRLVSSSFPLPHRYRSLSLSLWLGVYPARPGPNPRPAGSRRRRCPPTPPPPAPALHGKTSSLLPRPWRRCRSGGAVSPPAPIWASPALTPPDSARAVVVAVRHAPPRTITGKFYSAVGFSSGSVKDFEILLSASRLRPVKRSESYSLVILRRLL